MQKFRTIVEPPKSSIELSYKSKSMFLGSCFTENIGNILAGLKFQVDINPFGIMYNPLSVKMAIDFLLESRIFTKQDLSFHNDRWFSFYHHSNFSDIDADKCLRNINMCAEKASEYIRKMDCLFITFGTAWAYKLKQTNNIISNCHKLPSNNFDRFLFSADSIVDEYIILIDKLLKINSKLKIVFTVSPIRHWKDGANGNQISKATLLLAINKLVQNYKEYAIEYFPAYEIVMDDLRDYRFYKEDMMHPNKTAIQYIWSKFTETYIPEKDKQLIERIDKLIKARNHKPFNSDSNKHKQFMNKNLKTIDNLISEYPFLNLVKEREYFNVDKVSF